MSATGPASVQARASRHAALGDPVRLAIIDALARSDRTVAELQAHTGLASNHLAYHLDILEAADLILRCQSSGDRRRRYICLRAENVAGMLPPAYLEPQPALFICTQNSARSHLAAALWQQLTASPAASAGTDPARRVHRSAVAAGRRAGLDLTQARPRRLDDVVSIPDLVVTVCDQAHEQLAPLESWLHWSIPDPVGATTPRAFDATIRRLKRRISALTQPAG